MGLGQTAREEELSRFSAEGKAMRLARLLAVVLLGILFAAVPAYYTPTRVVWAAQTKRDKKEVKVWVNTNSGVYHCPGTRWYGETKQGSIWASAQRSRMATGLLMERHAARAASEIAALRKSRNSS